MDYLFNGEDKVARIDYLTWAQRIVGWDALLPLVISAVAFAIATLQQQPADILALVGLPVAAFLLRLAVGCRQINDNNVRDYFRLLQFCALLLAIFALVIVDFFVTLAAFVPAGNGPPPNEIKLTCLVAVMVYFGSIALAMYPGRCLTSRKG